MIEDLEDEKTQTSSDDSQSTQSKSQEFTPTSGNEYQNTEFMNPTDDQDMKEEYHTEEESVNIQQWIHHQDQYNKIQGLILQTIHEK